VNIRSIFGLTRPNAMRPLLRIPPFETFLKKHRARNGKTYDLFTFKEFCKQYHYDYEDLMESQNPNANIPCGCSIMIRTIKEEGEEEGSEESPDSSLTDSLNDALSVEFQVNYANLLCSILFKPKLLLTYF